MSTYENNLRPIKKLHTDISKWVDEETCKSFFKRICDDYDAGFEKTLFKDHWRNSQVRKLLQVHERLSVTDALKGDIGDDSLKRYKYPELITYLRLTCFDQLGQPGHWRNFSDWIKSKKKKEERELIAEGIKSEERMDFSSQLYDKYQELYGVKNAFFNFLQNVIPCQVKLCLLELIRVRIYDNMPPHSIKREATDNDKEIYLYTIRNDFTHNTYSTGYKLTSKTNLNDEWNFRETLHKGEGRFSFSSHNSFEEKLKEVVLIGIAEIIKKG